jgi:hypothetical protein
MFTHAFSYFYCMRMYSNMRVAGGQGRRGGGASPAGREVDLAKHSVTEASAMCKNKQRCESGRKWERKDLNIEVEADEERSEMKGRRKTREV